MDKFYRIKGNTWCMDTGTALIGIYRLDERDVVLLDSGSSFLPDESAFVMGLLEAEGLEVKAVIATHGHWDHIGNNKALREKYGCEIYMYGAEGYITRAAETLRFQWAPTPYQEVQPLLARMESVTTAFIGREEKEMKICGRKFGILHTPGHSRSHISVVTEDNVVMLGDAVLSEQVLRHSKLPYAENISVHFETMRMLEGLDYDYYILSHKGVMRSLRQEIEKNIAYFKSRAEAVAACVKEGMSRDDIIAAVIEGMHIRITCRFDYADICELALPFIRYLEEVGRLETWYEKGYVRYRVREQEGLLAE